MDSDKPSSTGRKVRFKPKAPVRRKTRADAQLKKEEPDDAAEAEELRRHLDALQKQRLQRTKGDGKSSVQAAFIHGPKQSIGTRASNVSQDGSRSGSSGLDLEMKPVGDGGEKSEFPSSAALNEMRMISAENLVPKPEYREPWDYAHTYYPNCLPWRKPYSGDPEVLDEAEFGEAASNLEYDESTINPASELGFLDSNETSDDVQLLFFQLPPSLPVIKRPASVKGKEKVGTSAASDQGASMSSVVGGRGSSVGAGTSQRSCSLEELSGGHMGKLHIYKSGAIKLKLGDTLYDVSPGSDCTFAQEVVAVNTKEEQYCAVGELHKRAIVTPDIGNLLNSVIDLG